MPMSKKDLKLAQEVINYDDVVDDLFRVVKHDLIHRIHDNIDTGQEAREL